MVNNVYLETQVSIQVSKYINELDTDTVSVLQKIVDDRLGFRKVQCAWSS